MIFAVLERRLIQLLIKWLQFLSIINNNKWCYPTIVWCRILSRELMQIYPHKLYIAMQKLDSLNYMIAAIVLVHLHNTFTFTQFSKAKKRCSRRPLTRDPTVLSELENPTEYPHKPCQKLESMPRICTGQHYYIVLFSPLSPFQWSQNIWPWMTLGYLALNSVFAPVWLGETVRLRK